MPVNERKRGEMGGGGDGERRKEEQFLVQAHEERGNTNVLG